jgi:hypothetical protein
MVIAQEPAGIARMEVLPLVADASPATTGPPVRGSVQVVGLHGLVNSTDEAAAADVGERNHAERVMRA